MSTDLLTLHLESVNKRVLETISNIKRKIPKQNENELKDIKSKNQIIDNKINRKRARNSSYIGYIYNTFLIFISLNNLFRQN